MLWPGCQKIEYDSLESVLEEALETPGQVWTLTVRAEKVPDGPAGNDDTTTKGLAIGDGTESTTTLIKSIWKSGDEVNVYQGSTFIGTLTAQPDLTDAHKATLSGSVTTSGITAGSTTLTMLTPRKNWNYTGQEGTLLSSDNSIEKKYHYTMATNVLVKNVSGSSITTENASFYNQQSIYRLSFRYQVNSTTLTPVKAKSVSISGANNKLVQNQVVGGATTKGPIEVTLNTATTDPFFVALRNGDTKDEEISFIVIDDNGATYSGTKTLSATVKANGSFVSLKNATLTRRLELGAYTYHVGLSEAM